MAVLTVLHRWFSCGTGTKCGTLWLMPEEPGVPFNLEPDLVTDQNRSSEIDALRELAMRTRMGGQIPVILSIEDVPEHGSLAYLAQLGTLRNATLQVNLNETIDATSIRFTRKQALALAVRLTEMLGPLDSLDHDDAGDFDDFDDEDFIDDPYDLDD